MASRCIAESAAHRADGSVIPRYAVNGYVLGEDTTVPRLLSELGDEVVPKRRGRPVSPTAHAPSLFEYRRIPEIALRLIQSAASKPDRDALVVRASECGVGDVWTRRWTYACGLAEAAGRLSFEEMFLLVGVLDDLEALKGCGFAFDDGKEARLRLLCLERFLRQRGTAASALQASKQHWKEHWWHYTCARAHLGA